MGMLSHCLGHILVVRSKLQILFIFNKKELQKGVNLKAWLWGPPYNPSTTPNNYSFVRVGKLQVTFLFLLFRYLL